MLSCRRFPVHEADQVCRPFAPVFVPRRIIFVVNKPPPFFFFGTAFSKGCEHGDSLQRVDFRRLLFGQRVRFQDFGNFFHACRYGFNQCRELFFGRRGL